MRRAYVLEFDTRLMRTGLRTSSTGARVDASEG
jgi:hypothetical protein